MIPENRSPFREIRFRGKSRLCFVHEIGYPRFNEIDEYKVVWNGHYLNYFEIVRHECCRHCGFDLELLAKNGCYLPVYQYQVSIRRPVFSSDWITAAVTPVKLEENRFEFLHFILIGDDVRAVGTVTHVPMSQEKGEVLFSLPRNVANIFTLLKEKFDHEEKERLLHPLQTASL
ncbi:MAG: acyl-CoA thioesterase [Deltaproteobacteria bacterium]|nr:acyl-CoA thioesterase [Deltaproteobacteria bacterium]